MIENHNECITWLCSGTTSLLFMYPDRAVHSLLKVEIPEGLLSKPRIPCANDGPMSTH